ncbi:MAG TPA: prolyl oligopeptidase family serine peptidase [Bryobacteraceae bacterium]|nr:prolyl oligopeptidase family serine peptidase [Bryobacteraceae bacterium]
MTRFGICCAVLATAAFAQPPATPKKPVIDTYHGVQVTDDYRWLENYSDAPVRTWSDAQNRYARRYLDALPQHARLLEDLKRLYSQPTPSYFGLESRPGALFALKIQPPREQFMLVTLKSAGDTGSERVIVDPNQLDPSGGTEIDFFVPSLDGKLVAVSLSKGGSESGDVHVYETATGHENGAPVPRVNGGTAGGSVAWNADGSGFYYTRYPRGSERPTADLNFYQQIYFHRLGTDTKQDAYSLGKEFPRIAEIQLKTSPDGRYTLATMANGDGGDFAHYLHGPDGQWHQIARLSDEISSASFGADGYLYLLTHLSALKGKILRIPLDKPSLSGAQAVVPENRTASIASFLATGNMLYVADVVGGPSQIRIFDTSGKAQGTVPIPPISSVNELVRSTGDELLFQNATYLDPPAWYRYDPSAKKVAKTALYETSTADFSDTEVVREFATSKDGTKVPLNIIRRKGAKLDGKNPALLTGYGGYDISLTPNFSLGRRLLLDRGVVIVVANLRGGGEYGEAWHHAGMMTKKQNVFDDFAACARYLIDHKYTSAAKLAIEGGSNGGLLMGAALTQHPDLYGAVVSHVGIYDMLRVELHPNGAFNVTEFGTVKEDDQFKALYAYSPYHHVVDGTNYPPVLFLTGDNDPRVDPANSRKMTARLQAAGAKQVYLRTSGNSGHGIGTAFSEAVAEQADVLAFLFDQWGIK